MLQITRSNFALNFPIAIFNSALLKIEINDCITQYLRRRRLFTIFHAILQIETWVHEILTVFGSSRTVSLRFINNFPSFSVFKAVLCSNLRNILTRKQFCTRLLDSRSGQSELVANVGTFGTGLSRIIGLLHAKRFCELM